MDAPTFVNFTAPYLNYFHLSYFFCFAFIIPPLFPSLTLSIYLSSLPLSFCLCLSLLVSKKHSLNVEYLVVKKNKKIVLHYRLTYDCASDHLANVERIRTLLRQHVEHLLRIAGGEGRPQVLVAAVELRAYVVQSDTFVA